MTLKICGTSSGILQKRDCTLFYHDRSTGIATCYGLDGLGIESRWGRDFLHLSRPALGGPPSLLYNAYRVFPGVKSGRSVMLTPHPLLVSWSRKSRGIPLLPLRGRTALYRASVSVQECTFIYLLTYSMVQSPSREANHFAASQEIPHIL